MVRVPVVTSFFFCFLYLLLRLEVCGSSARCDKLFFSFSIPFGVIFFLSYNGNILYLTTFI